jgi:hypothetical protein
MQFDTATRVHHPYWVTVCGRAFALLLTLALTAGNIGVCAGWAASAAARMACCAEDAACPMDTSVAHTHGTMSQAQADSCCAVSERQSTDSRRTVAAVDTPTALRPAFSLWQTVPAPLLRRAWIAPPRCGPGVSRHVLHSVFLV